MTLDRRQLRLPRTLWGPAFVAGPLFRRGPERERPAGNGFEPLRSEESASRFDPFPLSRDILP
jgi:hypothetical protein